VILDGNFIFTAIKYKIDLRNRIETLLQGSSINFFVLKSVLKEMETIGAKGKQSLEFAKNFCEMIDDDRVVGDNPAEKLMKLLGNLLFLIHEYT